MPSTSRRAAAALLALALGAAARPSFGAAQAGGGGLPDLNAIRPASAPAFVVLGVAPTDVTRPGTPADLGLSLANATERFTTVPQNYALETSPYWLAGHPELTWQADSVRTTAQSIRRTFAVSAATAVPPGADSTRAGLALGFRTLLRSGRIPKALRDSLLALDDSVRALGSIFKRYAAAQTAVNDAWSRAERARIRQMTDTAAQRAAMEAFQAENNARLTSLNAAVEANPGYQTELAAARKRIPNLALRREGSMLELAAGAAWGFPDRVWKAGRLDRVGAWLTYGCERCVVAGGTVPITPLVMVRYYHGGAADGSVPNNDVVDAGGRLVVTGARYDLSAEGVVRSFVGSDAPKSLYRVTGNFDYQVGPGMWLLTTFGRDYQSKRSGSLIAELGVKFNFAHNRYTGAPGS